ncbi:gibberellin 2-beta-dioxygenase 6, partial [Quercus suber]
SIRSCDEFGFIKVINHGNPLGYHHINIGSREDMGELEYLLLNTHLYYIVEKSITISYDPS